MHRIYDTNNRAMNLHVTIICNGTKTFRVWCEELGKVNSKYADRLINVTSGRTIYFSLPVSPKELFIGCVNAKDVNDKDFQVILKEEPPKLYNIYLDDEAKQFAQFGINFCQVSGFKQPAPMGTYYQTKDEKFRIKYMPKIIDYVSGTTLNTPARIGHNTGIIEINAEKFNRYTIPMRFMILLHEFSHKYRNPKIGLQISNEFGADINGLYIYLGLGFSKIDAITVFAKVFLKAQTDSNIQRMRKIQQYIQSFENQEYAELL
jgi:hypothetical protein